MNCFTKIKGRFLVHTQEEKKAKEEKDAVIAAAKKRGQEKAKLTKSLIIMDVKPWDDTTGVPPLSWC